jgi:hypothetical protein
MFIVLVLVFLGRTTGPSRVAVPDEKKGTMPPVTAQTPMAVRPSTVPLPPPQRAEFVAEAQRAILARLGGERTARFGDAVVVDLRQRVVCGEVVPLGAGASMNWKRYVSFGGTGIALVDDGSADFAEIHLSACTAGSSFQG